ncbi:MAG TPA: helix-turn-helix domain-containing protein [Bacilli bacterium]
MRFGDKLKVLRENRGISQQELGDRFHLSQSIIGYYETNKREPSINTLMNFANFFDVSVDYLIGYNEESKGQVKLKIPAFKKREDLNSHIFIDLDEIKCISNGKKFVTLSVGKKEIYYSVNSFETYINLLNDYDFIQVSSSVLVNKKHIASVDNKNYMVYLGEDENAIEVSISRSGLHYL